MNLHFHVIQYLDDPMAGEAKNLGVLAHDGRRGYFRMLGVADYRVRTGFFSAISPKAHASAWAYREWAEWFRRLVSQAGEDQSVFMSELARLEEGQHLRASGEGILEMASNGHPEEAMDYLFGRLVQAPKLSPALAFEDELNETLSRAEIVFREDFHTDVEVELVNEHGVAPVHLEFSYFLSGERPAAFRTFLFEGRSAKSLEKNAAAIASTFELAASIGFLDRKRCVVLCDRLGAEQQPYVGRLSELAHVLDVSDTTTPDIIHSIAYAP